MISWLGLRPRTLEPSPSGTGLAGAGAQRKVSLTNPYSYDATYTFYSDQLEKLPPPEAVKR